MVLSQKQDRNVQSTVAKTIPHSKGLLAVLSTLGSKNEKSKVDLKKDIFASETLLNKKNPIPDKKQPILLSSCSSSDKIDILSVRSNIQSNTKEKYLKVCLNNIKICIAF
jgi:type VI protein secretion system component Hcp